MTNASFQRFVQADLRTKGLYEKALSVRSAVPHPKIMGVIRECGGKMYMSEGKQGMRSPCSGSRQLTRTQRTGRRPRATSSNRSGTTMRPARYSVSRC